MLIEISGSRCISCAKYTQHYAFRVGTDEMEPINYGYCGQRQRVTRPGCRCKYYRERSNVGVAHRLKKEDKEVMR